LVLGGESHVVTEGLKLEFADLEVEDLEVMDGNGSALETLETLGAGMTEIGASAGLFGCCSCCLICCCCFC
jgi:hypothetical protein